MNSIPLLFSIFIVFTTFLSGQEKVWINEEFDDNSRGWTSGDHKIYRTKIEDGKYYIKHKRTSGSRSFWIAAFIDPDKDYEIEAKIKQFSGIDNHGYGIVWGTKDANRSYDFIISSNGYFEVYEYKDGEFVKIYGWEKISYVNPMGEDNILKIRRENKTTYFYVNGEQVYSMPNISLKGANLGFVLNKEMAIEVDYIRVRQDNEINLVDDLINGFELENLGKSINSKYDEVTPVISPDGKTIFLCRKEHPDNAGEVLKDDIWYARLKPDNTWSELKNIGKPLNNSGHNSVISVSPDGNTMLIMNTYNEDGSSKGPGISLAQRSKHGWIVPKTLVIEDYYNNNKYSNFCLSADRNILLMAIEREDSNGDQDIYVSFKDGDKYSEPKNLGDQINTYTADISPFLAADNRTLYYSTKGKPGYGSSDIFVTRRMDDSWTNWSEPKNLGPEINTKRWEAYYTIAAAGEYAYLSSVKNSYGKGDIFRIKQPEDARPDPVVLVYGNVLNAKTNEPLEADIIYSELISDAVIGTASSEPDSGFYKIILPYGKVYSFLAAKEGFYSISDNMDVSNITEYQEIERDLYLSPIEVGEVIRLNNVFFDYNRSTLKKKSYSELNRLIKILNEYPNMLIEIAGHTDSDGSETYNQQLSEDRVDSVVAYIVSQNILKNRLQGKGYGELKPIATNETDEGKALNRRVEFKILKK